MSPEEYQRIKEAEKEHLRKLKELKSAVRLLRRRNSVNQALGDMATGPQAARDVHDEMVEKLAIETAQKEARMEIALENAKAEEVASAQQQSTEAFEEEMLKERAKSLLRQIKLEMGTPMEEASAPSSSAAPKERIATPEVPRADKTLGRPAPAAQRDRDQPAKESPADAELPEKTIGRMKQ